MAMTTEAATGLPEAWASLQAALAQRRAVHVRYHGRQRLICPHTLGWKNRRAMVLEKVKMQRGMPPSCYNRSDGQLG